MTREFNEYIEHGGEIRIGGGSDGREPRGADV